MLTPPDGPGHDARDLFAGQTPVHLYNLPTFGLTELLATYQDAITIEEAIGAAIMQARRTHAIVQFDFNGMPIRVAANTDPNLIQRDIERPSMRREVMLGHAAIGPNPNPVLTEDQLLEDMQLRQEEDRAAAVFREKLAARKALMRLLVDLPPLEIVQTDQRDQPNAIEAFAYDADFRIAYTAGLDWATLVQHYVDAEGMDMPDAAARAMEEMDATHVFSCESEHRPNYFRHGFSGWKYEAHARDWLENWLYPPETDISDIAHLDPDND